MAEQRKYIIFSIIDRILEEKRQIEDEFNLGVGSKIDESILKCVDNIIDEKNPSK